MSTSLCFIIGFYCCQTCRCRLLVTVSFNCRSYHFWMSGNLKSVAPLFHCNQSTTSIQTQIQRLVISCQMWAGISWIAFVLSENCVYSFLEDRRRLNVSLTRARYALYIIGNMHTLQQVYVVHNNLHTLWYIFLCVTYCKTPSIHHPTSVSFSVQSWCTVDVFRNRTSVLVANSSFSLTVQMTNPCSDCSCQLNFNRNQNYVRI